MKQEVKSRKIQTFEIQLRQNSQNEQQLKFPGLL